MKSLEERKASRKASREQVTRQTQSGGVLSQEELAKGAEKPKYDRLNKDQLIKLVMERGYELDNTETKADLVATLIKDDAEADGSTETE